MKDFKCKKIFWVVLIITLLTTPFLFSAAPKYVLKFNHVLGASEPYHEGFLKWSQNVEKRTNGEVKIEVYHSAQLGVEEDIIEQIRRGANIGQNTDSARLGNYVPDIAVMNAAYFVDTVDEVKKLKDLPVVKDWIKTLEKKYGMKVLSFFWIQGFRHFVTNKPIKTPDDLKGLRIRTPPAPIWQESIRACGATPVALAFGEMYPAIQQKAIDGLELVYNNLPAGRFYEVLKYVNETKHILLINFEVTSAKWFNSLPKKYQDIVLEECDKVGLEVSDKIMGELANRDKKLMIDKGMIINTDIDMAAFKKAANKAYEKLNLTKVRTNLYKQLGKKD
ncbi:MAG: C4-dicarboxylate TRAP transporter substrate-binding protein [Spirochaetes bacterium]|nr:C4-dicarboxylate TRAP transporter substrate-binding protein [Spirochaetota bacterium]